MGVADDGEAVSAVHRISSEDTEEAEGIQSLLDVRTLPMVPLGQGCSKRPLGGPCKPLPISLSTSHLCPLVGLMLTILGLRCNSRFVILSVLLMCIISQFQLCCCAPSSLFKSGYSAPSEPLPGYLVSSEDSTTVNLTALVDYVKRTSPLCGGSTKTTDLLQQFPVLATIAKKQSLDEEFTSALTLAVAYTNYFSRWISEGSRGKTAIENSLTAIMKTNQQIRATGACIGTNPALYKSKDSPAVIEDACTSVRSKSKSSSADNSSGSRIVTLQDGVWENPVCDPKDTANVFRLRRYIPFYNKGLHGGVLFFDFDLREVNLNQCNTKTDRCNSETTMCVYEKLTDVTFDVGNYKCKCRKTFYNKNGGFLGTEMEKKFALRGSTTEGSSSSELPNCIACKIGCESCTSGDPCVVEYEIKLLRGLPLAVQSFCITVCLVVMVIIFRIRRTRVIKASNWVLLEIFLLGAIFLYSTIVVMYFPPNYTSCNVLPWLREIGFAVTYGTLLVKVYRVLSGFQSRKAHRVHVRDKDMLKYLGGFIILAIGYMASWTAVNMDHHLGLNKSPMMEKGHLGGEGGLVFEVCRAQSWDIVIEIIEFLFLGLGIYYCHCVRSAPSEYNEMRFITIALINETVLSAILHIVRHFVWYTLHPDYVYLMYFIRCHATVTVTVALIIGPKFWFLHRPPSTAPGRPRAVPNADSHLVPANKLNLASNGDLDIGEINLADMDPEDIRRELKRLYTQVEIYKTKAMRKDNPHVSKRRGGRKQRRFSLQPFYKKHHASASVHEEEVSKLSEESTNSGDDHQQPGQQSSSKTP